MAVVWLCSDLETGFPWMYVDQLESHKKEEVLMKVPRLLMGVAIAATLSVSLLAQRPSTGYHTVACIKINPNKGSEFRKWAAEDLHKYAQSRVDTGAVFNWYLLRSIMPQGNSAECDYLIVAMFPGAPPKPLGLEELGVALKKAGITASAQEYVDRRNSLTTLVSQNLFQNLAVVGEAKKGDYFTVNYMKSANLEDYIAYEKKVWQPLAEAMDKDGFRRGWSLNVQVLPSGADLPFQAVTVDVFPSWDSIFKNDAQFVERFKKVHPDMELGTTFEQFEKLRTLQSTKLYALDDFITAAK
jgi:hypothetical protein